MRVLVIDDSSAMRMILRRTLVSLGHEVVEATNGQEGLDRLAGDGPFEIALVDWNMPVLNGIDFVRRTRADYDADEIKLMMVTTEIEMANVEAAMQAGADEYLMKPFTADVLRQKIDLLVAT